MHQNFRTHHYAGLCTKIYPQSAHYAGYVDSNMDFFSSLGLPCPELPHLGKPLGYPALNCPILGAGFALPQIC